MKKFTTNHPSPKRRKRLVVVAVLLLLMLLVGSGVYWRLDQQKAAETPTLRTPRRGVGDVDYSQPKKEERSPTLDTNDQAPKNLTPQQNVPASKPIAILITHAEGTPLQVGVIIQEILSNGTCTLTLSRPGASDIVKSAAVFNGPSSTTCQGFSVESIPAGTWKLTIAVESGGRRGSTTQEVKI